MYYKKASAIILLIIVVYSLACFSSNEKVKNMKDFNENMLDIRIYHENLGDALLTKNKDYAVWLVNDMDSILILMADKFTSHRKLTEPFKYHYQKKLAPYLNDLKKGINREEWTKAIRTYSVLTRKCNGCHIDHDIEKEVKDVTKQ